MTTTKKSILPRSVVIVVHGHGRSVTALIEPRMTREETMGEQERLYEEVAMATLYEAITSILQHYSYRERSSILQKVVRWSDIKRQEDRKTK